MNILNTLTSAQIEERATNLATLKNTLEALNKVVEQKEQNRYDFSKKMENEISNFLQENIVGLDKNTKVEFLVDTNYNRIFISNTESRGGWNGGFEITVILNNFSELGSFGKNNDIENFDGTNGEFSFKGSSSEPNLDNYQSLDTAITKGWLAVELKNYAQNTDSFFTYLGLEIKKYFALKIEERNARKDTYPISSQIREIENEIKSEEKARLEVETIATIEETFGTIYTISEDSKARNIGSIIGREFNQTYLKFVKKTAKTITFEVMWSIDSEWGETARLSYEHTVKLFSHLVVAEDAPKRENA